jgi:chitodextrinase
MLVDDDHGHMKVPTLRGITTGALGVIVAVTVSTSAAQAATPLPTPGTPVATTVTTTSIAFTWSASSGPVANYTVQVSDGNVLPWRDVGTTSATSYTHSGLVPDTTYQYRVIANPAPGSGYTASAPSGILNLRTAPLPDSVPPTKPGTPTAYQLSTVAVTLNFLPSTDNNRVAGYWAQRQVNGVWTDWETNNITTIYLRNLTPNTTYTVVVVAFDANGNRSPRSDPLTFTTRALQPTPTCRVQVLPFSFNVQLNITLENMTASTVVDNWTLTFSMVPEQLIFYFFNVTITRIGNQVTLTPAVWFTRIGPGGSFPTTIFATYPAGTPLPSGFTFHTNVGTFACTT